MISFPDFIQYKYDRHFTPCASAINKNLIGQMVTIPRAWASRHAGSAACSRARYCQSTKPLTRARGAADLQNRLLARGTVKNRLL